MLMKAIVQFNNVSKRYRLGLARRSLPSAISQWLKRISNHEPKSTDEGYLWVLKDVSFQLEPGQSLALVGSNGAGKTTILRHLGSITKPTSGNVIVKGTLSALIELGAGFHPDLTGRENIYLNATILGLTRREIDRRFDEIVDFSELPRFIDTPIKRYSSGMIVRLGFAVASCIEPEILLVDEVLAVGDVSFQQKCLRRVHELIEKGTSLIFVSHNIYLVQAACNLGLYLQNGQVKYYGSVRDVITMYEQDLHRERAQKFQKAETASFGEKEGEVEITRVEAKSAGEAESDVFFSDCPLEIRVHYNAYISLGEVNLSVFIVRSDGTMCCMMRSKLDAVDLIVDKGSGVITITLTPLQLVGGTYYAEAYFLDSLDSMVIARMGRSDWFTVHGKALSYNERSVFEPNTHWCHNQIDKAFVFDNRQLRTCI
jgi:lipopolysaccharide transport system ATP-binding protein